MLLVVIVLFGCSPESRESSRAKPSLTPTVAAQSSAAELDPVDRSQLLAAIDRLGEMPHRAEVFLPDIPSDAELDADRPILRIDFDGTWSSTTNFFGPGQADGRVMATTITDRSTAYFRFSGLSDLPGPGSLLTGPWVDAVDDWVSLDLARLETIDATLLPIDVGQTTFDLVDGLLETVASATTILEGPPSSSRGIPTRTFTTTIDVDGAVPSFDSTTEITLHLDDQNRIREVRSRNDRFGEEYVEFFDLEAAIQIELPVDAIDKTEEFGVGIAPGAFADEVGDAAPPSPSATPDPAADSILGLIDARPELSTFRSLLTESGLDSMFAAPNPEPWTVFAPTNDALDSLGRPFDELRENPLRLRTFVSEHLAPGDYDKAGLEAAGSIRTFQGALSFIGVEGDCLAIRDACVSAAALTAIDGTIHIVDAALASPAP